MGTDMHVAVQRRKGDRWEQVERPWPNPEFGKYDDEPEFVRNSLYLGRNYRTFAVVAGGKLLDARFRDSPLHA
ncbi:MAG: hypothetical protein ACO1SV_07660 [Fimbriimonas sp.]